MENKDPVFSNARTYQQKQCFLADKGFPDNVQQLEQ